MKLQRYLPAETLRPFVRHFLIVESAEGMVSRIVPDTALVMAFRLSGCVTDAAGSPVPAAAISGVQRTACLLRYGAQTATLLAVFHDGAAGAFFKEPLHHLQHARTSLDHFFSRSRLEETAERLASATGNAARVAVIEQLLLAQLLSAEPDYLVREAMRQIKFAGGDLRIKDLLAGLHISRDAFEKRFRRVVGTSPKQAAGIVRMQHLIHQHTPAASLTGMAHIAGYFDQAHFIKDFRSFTGLLPREFFASPARW